jgi:hypothetical protein
VHNLVKGFSAGVDAQYQQGVLCSAVVEFGACVTVMEEKRKK